MMLLKTVVWVLVVALSSLGVADAQMSRCAMVVIVMDESGSMGSEQEWIKPTLPQLFQGLEAVGLDSGGNMACVVGYEGTVNRPLGCSFFLGSDEYDDKFLDFILIGGTEDGYSAMDYAMDQAEDFISANAMELDDKCTAVIKTIVLITDENRDVVDSTITETTLRETFTQDGWIVNTILSVNSGNIGYAGNGSTYVLDVTEPRGYSVTPPGTADPSTIPVAGPEYAVLAWDFGGVTWNLNALRTGGDAATAFGNAFVDIKVEEIIISVTAAPTAAPTMATQAPAISTY